MNVYQPLHRRQLLQRAGAGFGGIALASLLQQEQLLGAAPGAVSDPLAPKKPHHESRAKAKRVIWLFMNGGPSQVDTWNYRPELEKRDGKELEGFDKNTGFFTGQVGPLMKSPFKFAQHGESGAWASEIFPHMSQHIDKMAFLHSCHTESNNHSPALFMANCGLPKMGYPCVGSWVNYGLGSESRDLPAFIVMSDPKGRGLPKGYSQNWGAGFLPSVYQGTWLKPTGDPIDNLKPPAAMDVSQQRRQLDLASSSRNSRHLSRNERDPRLVRHRRSRLRSHRQAMSRGSTIS